MPPSSLTSSAHAIVECSDQPLDLSFHPQKPSLLAAALVDGTLEVHDFEELLQIEHRAAPHHKRNNDNDDSDDDEVDTIVSSTRVHTQLVPSSTMDAGAQLASTRAVLFAHDGLSLYTGGSAGDVACIEAEQVTRFSAASQKSPVRWRIPHATHKPHTPIQVIREFTSSALSSSSPVVATGDEAGSVRLWDPRMLGSASHPSSAQRALPHGCVASWNIHEDYVSDLTLSSDGATLLSSSADCTLAVYDLRMMAIPTIIKTPVSVARMTLKTSSCRCTL
jgi:WD40 repeat protein